MPSWSDEIDAEVDALADDLRGWRRHLHANPEPSRSEYRTCEFLAGCLGEEGVPRRLIPSRRGVVAGPEGAGDAVIAFRADVDALRIHDAKDVAYRSQCEGVMHACGHDAHAAMALGAAVTLWRCRAKLPWPVAWRVLFQPAEEVGEGAEEMIAADALKDVRSIIALHVDPTMPAGRVGWRVGPLTAFCRDLDVKIVGRGGHAARPHLAVDPVAVAAQFVASVYQFAPRSVDVREAVVVTFGAIRGGEDRNVIPSSVDLQGTIRTLSWSTLETIEERLRRIGRGLAEAAGATIEVGVGRGVDAVSNDPGVTEVCVRAATELLGAEALEPIPLPSLGGEDFAAYLAHVPGCMLRLGVGFANRPATPLHSPDFDVDESALAVGAKLLARSVVRLAGEARGG